MQVFRSLTRQGISGFSGLQLAELKISFKEQVEKYLSEETEQANRRKDVDEAFKSTNPDLEKRFFVTQMGLATVCTNCRTKGHGCGAT